ncbi:P-loop containing nucleoside triphosphate hydrolase protein, partial [Mycena epipterygia]
MKRNKEECVQLMENIHKLLYAIANLHIKSETTGTLLPETLGHIGRFTETLLKIQTFAEAQQDGSKIKQFFRQSEMNTLLKDCRAGLQQAIEVFKIESGLEIFTSIAEIEQKTQNMHQELLDLIAGLSDGTASSRSFPMYQSFNDSQNSSNSLGMFPAKPQIFHGREAELQDIVKLLTRESARIAILGTGGMGKTSLAKAALHHPDIALKYEHRFFVACDSATTSLELAVIIGSHLGLKAGKDPKKPLVQYLTRLAPSLLILDNLDTPWEPTESRAGIEELLSLLTDVPHLALIITMRGAERPSKVRWSRPFLLPLQPLSDAAALQTFVDIADDFHDPNDINQLLRLTDNMPLAVNLIAHLTLLISGGFDRRSSLDASIMVSLSSPRITSLPGAKDLLSLLSILPDGLSDVELAQSNLPITNLFECKTTLLCTALAYSDDKWLKALMPIREHMQHFFPPQPSLVQPLQTHFHALLVLYTKYQGLMSSLSTINAITANLGNIQSILMQGLQ